MNSRNRILVSFLTILATALVYGQEQNGYVWGLRMDTASIPLGNVSISASNASNSVLSDEKGQFAIGFNKIKNGDRFFLTNVTKKGHELIDPELIGRPFAFSRKVPLVIKMVSSEYASQQLAALERNINTLMQKEYSATLNQLSSDLANAKITKEHYKSQVDSLENAYQRMMNVVSTIAKHYVYQDYDDLKDRDREIYQCLIAGDFDAIDNLIQVKGDLESRKNLIEDLVRQQRQRYEQERLELANDLYHKFTISLARFQPDEAELYIVTRAEVDSTNIDYLLDAASFLMEYSSKYDQAESLYNYAIDLTASEFGEVSQKMALCLNNLGALMLQLSKFDQALDLRQKSLAISKSLYGENHIKVAMAYNNIANTYYGKEDIENALLYSKKSVECVNADKDAYPSELAEFYNTLAGCYLGLGQLDKVQNTTIFP